jgi:hypothetical protein
MQRNYYSLEQANRLIPRIRPILKELIETHVKISIQNDVSISYDDPFEDLRQGVFESKKWHRTNHEYFRLFERLTDLGLFVKDPSSGVVDFFCLHEGREIFLCYKYPEVKIKHWHELEEDFAERKSIHMLKQASSKKV